MAQDVYSDVDDRLYRDMTKLTKDLHKDKDIEAVKNSILNVLTTKKMERRMLPEFGASLEKLLFEPIDDVTAKRIGEVMIQELKFWEPRINVNNLLVVANADQMRYDITMSYDVEACDIGRNSIEFILQQ